MRQKELTPDQNLQVWEMIAEGKYSDLREEWLRDVAQSIVKVCRTVTTEQERGEALRDALNLRANSFKTPETRDFENCVIAARMFCPIDDKGETIPRSPYLSQREASYWAAAVGLKGKDGTELTGKPATERARRVIRNTVADQWPSWPHELWEGQWADYCHDD